MVLYNVEASIIRRIKDYSYSLKAGNDKDGIPFVSSRGTRWQNSNMQVDIVISKQQESNLQVKKTPRVYVE